MPFVFLSLPPSLPPLHTVATFLCFRPPLASPLPPSHPLPWPRHPSPPPNPIPMTLSSLKSPPLRLPQLLLLVILFLDHLPSFSPTSSSTASPPPYLPLPHLPSFLLTLLFPGLLPSSLPSSSSASSPPPHPPLPRPPSFLLALLFLSLLPSSLPSSSSASSSPSPSLMSTKMPILPLIPSPNLVVTLLVVPLLLVTSSFLLCPLTFPAPFPCLPAFAHLLHPLPSSPIRSLISAPYHCFCFGHRLLLPAVASPVPANSSPSHHIPFAPNFFLTIVAPCTRDLIPYATTSLCPPTSSPIATFICPLQNHLSLTTTDLGLYN